MQVFGRDKAAKGKKGERTPLQFDAQLLALVLDRVSDAFAALDNEDCYTYVNAQAARIFGRTAEEMIGENIWSLFPDSVEQAFYQAYQRAVQTQELTFIENFYAPWGRWIESRIYPSPDGVSIFFHDISDRKRAEALLVGQSHLLELITNGAGLKQVLEELLLFIEAQCLATRASVLLLDEDGVHMHHGASPSLPESFTRPINGAVIGPCAGSCGTAAYLREPVFSEDIATDPRWEHWRALALPLGLRACWSTPIFDDKRRVLGTFAMYYAEPSKLRERDKGVVAMATRIAAIAITHDQAQTARRQSEGRYRRLIDSNVIGVMILDRDGVVKEANDEFLRIIGQTRSELSSGLLHWHKLIPEDYLTRGAEIFARLAESGACPSLDQECLHGRGHRVWIRVTAAQLADSENDSICLVEDITEQREQARLREKNVELEKDNRAAQEASRLKSEFLASMSHELRTPLNAVIGFSELLVDGTAGPLNEKQHECLGHVLVSGRHLLRLINDVLDLAKVEAGKLELFPAQFQLCAELEEVCSVARTLAKEKNITVTAHCDPALGLVTLDPQKLRQVLFNLLANAVKFTGDGGSVHVEARALTSEALEISVRDDGIGISDDDLPKLFQEFRQLDSGAARRHEGTGLGLVLAKRLVESQRGHIGVESKLGKGSTFWVVLPLELRLDARSTPPGARH